MFTTFYFYRKIAYKVLFFTYITSGIWVWIMARSAYHIGASGLVYSLVAFIITSGIIRNNIRLLSISLIVVFLYGSLSWGLFPSLPNISWESHLMGAISGIIIAIYYKKEIVFEEGLPSFRFDEYYEDKFWETDLTTKNEINYEYKEKK
jgi:membrane associated rhomboid family serine protease